MKRLLFISLLFLGALWSHSCRGPEPDGTLARHILDDPTLDRVDSMARVLLTEGFNAGSGFSTYPNGFLRDNPHGPENWSTVPNTVNETLCMGHQGIVRLFPVWPREQDASFHHIRVEGAFLVSATLRDGEIEEVTIVSEKGRDLTQSNPWDGQVVEITRPDGKTQLAEGKLIYLQTEPGGTYRFRPRQ